MPAGCKSSLLVSIAILTAAESFAITSRSTAQENSSPTQYLAFQIFTGVRDSEELRSAFPPPAQETGAHGRRNRPRCWERWRQEKKTRVYRRTSVVRHSDDHIRTLVRDSFSIALTNNIAVGFHIDDSIFWGRLSYLLAPENLEWLDWARTQNTGRRLDWGSAPLQVMPQLCMNSPAVEAEVRQRASLIAEAVTQGIARLQAAEKPELFAGVIAGWETQIGRDFATGRYLGYCALTNKGYSAANPPSDMNEARADITREFVDLWSNSLADAGVPDTKIFSHTAFIAKAVFDAAKFSQPGQYPDSYLETVNFAPPRVSFGGRRYAGFSTYPQFGSLKQIHAERANNNNPPWASAEGTAIEPSDAERGGAGESMEAYLGTLFSQGAVLVNVFGWGVGDANNGFRRVAENGSAIAAYQKFLRGERLTENAEEQIPSSQFFTKVRTTPKGAPTVLHQIWKGQSGSVIRSAQSAVRCQIFHRRRSHDRRDTQNYP